MDKQKLATVANWNMAYVRHSRPTRKKTDCAGDVSAAGCRWAVREEFTGSVVPAVGPAATKHHKAPYPGQHPCAQAGSGALRWLAPLGDSQPRSRQGYVNVSRPAITLPQPKVSGSNAHLVAAKGASAVTGVKRT